MKKLILGLLLLVSSSAMAQSTGSVIEAAKGNDTEVNVVKARVLICREIAKDLRPETVDNAIAWMRKNSFTEEAINQTQIVCIAYFQGILDASNKELYKTY